VEGASARALGLDLESSFELAVRTKSGIVAGEVTRYCVKRAYRCTPVARMLHAALTSESLSRGITHWFAAANMETDDPDEAALVYELVLARNLVDPRFRAAPRHHLPALDRRRCYTEEERAQARGDGAATPRLPRAIALFTGRMGARCIGAPAYDPYFNVFALPIVAKVQQALGAGVAATPPAMRSPTPARP
jgi:putative hemolysin